ncbi:MAG: sodium:proton antiporter [Sutterellaceae bacterium]|nr:sodium:proton antiporter [Burkholderiaceae bacterium]MCX7901403.1 sodium:proton antiporter [Burkholderiaceae bacterium]MDW8429140.1 sodium:proton antiporter [Sutterellaceae bacterium]
MSGQRAAAGALAGAFTLPAQAATLDGAQLGLPWALPFVGILLSIALLPLLALRLWHRHYGKIAVAWALAALLPLSIAFGPAVAADLALHTLLTEYLPFLIFIGTLYVIAGGIYVRGNLHGSPALNTALLAVGALLASLMGTTGAAMLLIRPLIRANDNRHYRVHTVVFFIFIVANIGGALTPLGDPPLFLGFLKGVDFFWTLAHMFWPMAFLLAALLAVFYLLDSLLYRRDLARGLKRDPTPDSPLRIEGGVNVLLLAAVVGTVLASGLYKSGVSIELLGQTLTLEGLLRDMLFLALAGISLAVTPRAVRRANEFGWAPIAEVAKLFFGIFLTMAPVLLMLKAGEAGAFAPLVRLVTDAHGQPVNAAYFWLTGALSSFLDNAPTYLVFFNLAGGDAQTLMTQMAPTLTAISAGAVFMGANTYIGNAPNFMCKAIAEERGIRMPSFFGYMLWSGALLLPLFVVMTFLFFR